MGCTYRGSTFNGKSFDLARALTRSRSRSTFLISWRRMGSQRTIFKIKTKSDRIKLLSPFCLSPIFVIYILHINFDNVNFWQHLALLGWCTALALHMYITCIFNTKFIHTLIRFIFIHTHNIRYSVRLDSLFVRKLYFSLSARVSVSSVYLEQHEPHSEAQWAPFRTKNKTDYYFPCWCHSYTHNFCCRTIMLEREEGK